jgi:carboxymethylenebutenolidase
MNQLDGPLPGQLVQLSGFGYDEASTEDSWQRILSFFGQHLPAAEPIQQAQD